MYDALWDSAGALEVFEQSDAAWPVVLASGRAVDAYATAVRAALRVDPQQPAKGRRLKIARPTTEGHTRSIASAD